MAISTLTGAEEIKWDLSDLYKGTDDPKLKTDLDEALTLAETFASDYKGRVADLKATELADAISREEDIHVITTRVGTFHYLRNSVDTADPALGAAVAAFDEFVAKLSTIILFFDLELAAVSDEKAAEFESAKELESYRHHLKSVRRYSPHLLSEPEEAVFAELYPSGPSAWTRLFDDLTAAIEVDVDGEKISLESASARLQNPSRDIRRTTHKAITEALNPGARTRGFILNTLLQNKSTEDRMRGYPSWIAARNLSNFASQEAVDALVDAVVGRYDIAQRYYKLKARILKIDDFSDFDRAAPIGESSSFVSWDEAHELISGAYAEFDPRVGKIVSDFFDHNWIDAAVTPNKSTGAYCATTIPGLHPYVFMNYTGERRSVLTLAHELGHGMHGVLASTQTPHNASATLTMAETASVFGEALTFKKLVSGISSPAEKLDLLMYRISDSIGTVFRQVAMNRFEDRIHTHRRTEGELSLDDFNGHWTETQTALFGDAVHITDEYKTWWNYIPHFVHTPGYVYAYAFGFLFSLAIFNKYQTEGDSIIQPYLDLLAAGGADTPENLAEIVGLNIKDPAFWGHALDALDDELKQAEELAI